MFGNFILPILRIAFFTCIARGALIVLSERGIHPDQWVASLLNHVISADAIGWILAGGIGILTTVIWETVRRNLPTTPTKAGILDNTIEFSWDAAPNDLVVPADGKYYDVPLSPNPVEIVRGGPFTATAKPGSTVTFLGNVYKCQVTNHGSTSIFNASIELQCVFREVDTNAKPAATITGSGPIEIKGEGKEIISRPWHINIPKSEANHAAPFVFYLSNPNEVWVHVSAPKTIAFQRLGRDVVETARLIPPFRSELTIAPPVPWMSQAPSGHQLTLSPAEQKEAEKLASYARRLLDSLSSGYIPTPQQCRMAREWDVKATEFVERYFPPNEVFMFKTISSPLDTIDPAQIPGSLKARLGKFRLILGRGLPNERSDG